MRMPPRMTTGASSPQIDSTKLFTSGGRGSAASNCPMPWRRASHTAGTISATPTSRPGTRPAAKSAGTEAPGTSTE